MRKKLLVTAGAMAMALGMSVSALADVPTDYEAYFTFDDKLDNEKGGSATAVEKGNGGTVGAAAEKTFDFVTGQNGKAVAINNGETKDNIGIDTGVTLNGTDSFTISFWAKAYEAPFAAPVVWAGATSQSTEAWIGFWSGFNGDAPGWNTVTGIGSNDASGARVGATASLSETPTFGYDYITMTVDATTHQGVLYYNGVEKAKTEAELPTLGDGAHIYVGANAWDAPANMEIDELVVYKRVLTADEVKSLYEVNGIPKADAQKVDQKETQADTTVAPVTFKPNLNNQAGLSNNNSSEEEDSSNTGIIIGVVVAVLVVAVVVGVVVATKKKSN